MVNSEVAPRIGLVSDNDFNRHSLHNILTAAGYHISVSLHPDKLAQHLQLGSGSDAVELDAWLVDTGEDDIQLVLDLLIEHTDDPLLVNDEVPVIQDHQAFDYWSRRLLEKLEVVAVRSQPTDIADNENKNEESGAAIRKLRENTTANYADRVWVLAASLGGPEAVKQFLQALPSGLPVAMVYAQHTGNNADGLLAETVGRQQHYPMHLARGEQLLMPGEVTVVPVDKQLRFLPFGRVIEVNKPWGGIYQPAIDQVIAELARIYRQRLGVIIFSGLCDDGKIGCRVVKSCGGTVWVQSPESCASDAMPQAAISTGCVSYQGTPQQLARTFIDYFTGGDVAPEKNELQERQT